MLKRGIPRPLPTADQIQDGWAKAMTEYPSLRPPGPLAARTKPAALKGADVPSRASVVTANEVGGAWVPVEQLAPYMVTVRGSFEGVVYVEADNPQDAYQQAREVVKEDGLGHIDLAPLVFAEPNLAQDVEIDEVLAL